VLLLSFFFTLQGLHMLLTGNLNELIFLSDFLF